MFSVKEIQKAIGGRLEENRENFFVEGLSTPEKPKENSVIVIGEKRFFSFSLPKNILLVTSEKFSRFIENTPAGIIYIDNPKKALVDLLEFLYPRRFLSGISDTAIIGENIRLGKDVYIGEYVILRDGVKIEDDVKIFPNTYIGEGTTIGAGTKIYPNTVVLENVTIGKNCIIQSGVVLGTEGFGFITDSSGHRRIPQIGKLIIGDEVEIGALTVIDKGAIDETVIERGTKIDSQVKIGHNVMVGEEVFLAAQTGIGGSSKLGNRVMMGGQSGVTDHVKVGDNTLITAASGVIGNLPSGSFVSGIPAYDHKKEYRAKAIMRKLPELSEELKELKRRILKIEERIKNNE